jgi:release factor glutamine methyltransferase
VSKKLKEIFLKQLVPVHGERETQNIFRWYQQEKSKLISEASVSDQAMNQFLFDIDLLSKNYPLQYLLGSCWFYDLKLSVGPGALIPRPETEEMIDLVLREHKCETAHILDIGTGSGCIALALKSKRPGWRITAVDISSKALQWARKNSDKHNLSITFDLLDILKQEPPSFPYDIIVSNPPYVGLDEKEKMSSSTCLYEPSEALFEKESLEFYRRLIQKKEEWLRPEGILYAEINEFKTEGLRTLLESNSCEFRIEKDINGKERFLILRAQKRL